MATAETPHSPARSQPLDVEALIRLLDGDDGDVRAAVRHHLASGPGLPNGDDDLDREAYRDRVLTEIEALGTPRATTFGIPRRYGGGGDLRAMAAAFEMLAFGDLSVLVKVGVQFGLFGGAIVQLGTTTHYRRFLPEIAATRLWGCFAMTEIGHGSDVQSIRTTATFDPAADEFVIHTPDRLACKEFIGNAARHGRAAVVFAQLRTDGGWHGVHALIVPLRDNDGTPCSGVTITDDGRKIGLNGVDNGRIAFDHVRVPRAALLDRYGTVDEDGRYRSPIESANKRFFSMLGTLVQGRVSIAGAAISAAEKALTIAIHYALRRRQFADSSGNDRLLLDHRLHRRRLLPLLARTYALHFAQQDLRVEMADVLGGPVIDPENWQRDTSAPDEQRRRALETRAAGMKAMATWHAVATISQCREACGGAGYMWENALGPLRADTDVFTTFEGDNHVLLQLVAKSLLTAEAAEFADLDPIGTVRWMAGQAWETVAERTSAYRLIEWVRGFFDGSDRWDVDAGLRDPRYQLAMLGWREEHQVAALARRIKHHTDAGEPDDEVFQRVQSHMVACGRSHVERVVHEAFTARVQAMADGPQKDAVTSLANLYALTAIESDRAWWMEHGRLTADRSKDITRTVDALCDEIRPLAGDLVGGFAVPKRLWDVPMLDQSRSG